MALVIVIELRIIIQKILIIINYFMKYLCI